MLQTQLCDEVTRQGARIGPDPLIARQHAVRAAPELHVGQSVLRGLRRARLGIPLLVAEPPEQVEPNTHPEAHARRHDAPRIGACLAREARLDRRVRVADQQAVRPEVRPKPRPGAILLHGDGARHEGEYQPARRVFHRAATRTERLTGRVLALGRIEGQAHQAHPFAVGLPFGGVPEVGVARPTIRGHDLDAQRAEVFAGTVHAQLAFVGVHED